MVLLEKFVCKGKDVFKHAVEKMSKCALDAIAHNGLTTDDIDFVVPHQANQRIIKSLGKKMKISEKKLVITVDKHANTSAASIPLALDNLVDSGLLVQGKYVVLEAIGGGLSWGSAVIKW